jgi:putative SOS response-associated peptidase YedK
VIIRSRGIFAAIRLSPAARKQPYRIMPKSGEPFAMAGIYDPGLGEAGSASITFAILTTTANEIMQPIHERMSVILPLGREKNWVPPNPSASFSFPNSRDFPTAHLQLPRPGAPCNRLPALPVGSIDVGVQSANVA